MPRASKPTRAAKAAKPASTKKTAAGKAAARKAAVRKAAVRKGAVRKGAVRKAAPRRTAAKKATPARKAAPTKKAAPVRKVAAVRKATARGPARKAAPAKKAAPVRKIVRRSGPKDKFLIEQEALLLAERATYLEQADALKAEADQLAAEMEPGDIQFDDESGEGGTANVDRERDLALSAQARQEVEEIDFALAKIASGTYGRCENCGQPIPRARLKAIPHARLCVACKSGGLSRR
jgi:DnaK suppressor protein